MAASAAYLSTGIIVAAADSICPEAQVVASARDGGSLIAALITVERIRAGSSITVRAPTAAALAELTTQCRRHANICTAQDASGLRVQPLWELVRSALGGCTSNPALDDGNFGTGMAVIGPELAGVAQRPGLQLVREAYPPILSAAIRRQSVRANARNRASASSSVKLPTQLELIALRHLWLGFEAATEHFVYNYIDSQRSRLRSLGCNEADVAHVKQGFEALRNAVSTLFVYVGTEHRVSTECPFYPYDGALLTAGAPIHRYVELVEPSSPQTDEAERNVLKVLQLAAVLTNRQRGGFVPYLVQRGLFVVDLFAGNGPGRCPFMKLTSELVISAGQVFSAALKHGEVLLSQPPTDEGVRFAIPVQQG